MWHARMSAVVLAVDTFVTTCSAPALLLCPTGLSDNAAGDVRPGKGRRGAAVRARELAAVALRVYEAGGAGIRVPLPHDHSLVSVLREALAPPTTAGPGSSIAASTAREYAALRAGAGEVASALLGMYLARQVRSCCALHYCVNNL